MRSECDPDPTEKAFEDFIQAHLLAHGRLQGSGADFDPKVALDPKPNAPNRYASNPTQSSGHRRMP